MNDAQRILEEAVEAHGGRAHWEELEAVEVDLSIGGPALGLKGSSPLQQRWAVRASTKEPRVRLGRPGGDTFVLDGLTVRREDEPEERALRIDTRRGRMQLRASHLDLPEDLGEDVRVSLRIVTDVAERTDTYRARTRRGRTQLRR